MRSGSTSSGVALSLALVLVGVMTIILLVVVPSSVDDSEEDEWWSGQPLVVSNGAVATESTLCSQMGADILEQGGNAVDAAIISDLCLGVVHCFATGAGGGGVMLIFNASTGQVSVLDYRETAPAVSFPEMYVVNNWSSTLGPTAAGVPGSLRGLELASKTYGRVQWIDLVTPVAELAKSFTVDEMLAKNLKTQASYILADPGLRSVFAPEGEVLEEGDLCFWTSLSQTLTRVAIEGADVIYTGPLAQSLVNDMNSTITTADLSHYTPVWRDPIDTFYQGYQVFGAPPPFSGGSILELSLNILELYNLPLQTLSSVTQHLIIQSWLFGYSDRTGEGDPNNPNNADLMTEFIPTMISKSHAASLRAKISDSTTYPVPYYQDLVPLSTSADPHGTSHLSAVDEQGNAVSLTSTVNLAFGSKYMSPSTGLIMNNEMDDFSTPGQTNSFGYPPSEANFPYPGLRPLSSMTPTIVTKNGQFFLAIGGSGGSVIPTATSLSLLNFMSFGDNLYDAVQRPRVHSQWVPDTLHFERGYPLEWVAELAVGFGYNISQTQKTANVQAIARNADGTLSAVSDRRKKGTPAGY